MTPWYLMGESARGELVHVDDPDDIRLAPYRDLSDGELRRRREPEEAIFVAEGRLAVGQLLGSTYEVRSLLVDDHQVTLAGELVEGVRQRGAPVYVATRQVVAATVGFALHRGVVAVGARPDPVPFTQLVDGALEEARRRGRRAVLAVAEGINDHENLGSLFRNAAAFGVGRVLLDPTCADPLYRRSVRVSVGHVLHVGFARAEPWPSALTHLRARGVRVAALTPDHTVTTVGRSDKDSGRRSGAGRGVEAGGLCRLEEWVGRHDDSQAVAVLVGAEGTGLSSSALELADDQVGITMAPGVDSLNVATAAAIAFYELSR